MKKLIAVIMILTVVLAALVAAIIILFYPNKDTEQADTQSGDTVTQNEISAESPTENILTGDSSSETGENISETETEKSRLVYTDEELKILEELIYEKADGKDISELLEKLREINPDARAAWDEILLFWDATREDGYVNTLESGGTAISQIDGCPVEDAHEGTLLPEGLPDDDSLCIICLGFQLYSDGRMRDELVGRLEVARACAMQYPKAWILVTGGPTAIQDRTITEADVMADWLIENGVEEERILIENRSMTSATNALFSYELLNENYPQVTDVAIVSSDYHISLGSQVFQAQFIMAREFGSRTELNVVANASYNVDMNEAFSPDIEANWLWILVREQVTDIHNIEGEM